jgi:hypothetical protein
LAVQLGGQSAFAQAVTTAPAASAPASFVPDSYSQRPPVATGSTFAQEFEGYTGPHDRGPTRPSSGTSKQQKDNTGQTAAVTPVTAATPPTLPLDLQIDFPGAQDDTESPADGANTNSHSAAAAGPQATTTQGPELAGGDPQTAAFMMRMQVAAANETSAPQQGLADAGIPGIKKLGEADAPDAPSLSQPVLQTQSALAAFEQGRQLEPGAEIKQAAAPSQAPELQPLRAEEQPHAPQPLNNILLQVNHSANEKVLVSVVQQSGELRLAVRTDDSELAQGLQQGLSDLVGKLQGSGYRADAWHPVQSSVAAGPTLESQNASNQSRQGDSQSQQGGSQQDGGQQRQNQSNRPRWVEELESTLTSREQTPGESYGFTS